MTEFNDESLTSNFSKKTIKSLVSAQMRIRKSRDTCKRLESWIDRSKMKDSKETTHKECKDVEKIKLKNLQKVLRMIMKANIPIEHIIKNISVQPF